MVASGIVSKPLKRVALVTSGLGTAYGGIGVVAKSIKAALEPYCKVSVWQHPPFWPRPLRIAKIAGHVFLGSQNPPDLVIYDHVHLAVLHGIVPKFRGVPSAVFIHGVEVWQPLHGRRREALLGASAIIANSTTTVEASRRVNPWLPDVRVAWLGIRSHSRQIDPGALPPTTLIVGRMSSPERYKGHDAVLNAWPLIRAAVPAAELVVIGTGADEPRLKRRVRDERLQGIEFRGRVSDEERDRAYCSSRLLFYPSEQEGFGLAGIEAASFGVPFLGLRWDGCCRAVSGRERCRACQRSTAREHCRGSHSRPHGCFTCLETWKHGIRESSQHIPGKSFRSATSTGVSEGANHRFLRRSAADGLAERQSCVNQRERELRE